MARSVLRWWFENRRTGQITVGQVPNWPLLAVVGTFLLEAGVGSESEVGEAASWTRVGLWVIWGGDELLRGVNPWRRLLGVAVLVWQAFSIASRW